MAPFQQKRALAHLSKPEGYQFGRPSDYRPEYCDLVIEEMAKGISLGAFAGVVGVAKETVYRWRARHSDFSDAVARAQAKQQLFWELKACHARKGAEVMASQFALKNIAPEQWRDLKQTQHMHSIVPASKLSDAQLNAIAAGASPADVGVDGTIEADWERVSDEPATG